MTTEYDTVPTALQEKLASDCKVYKIRWLILALFVLYSTSNAMQWIQFSIITDVVIKYYDISSEWVDWTSMVFMAAYAILIVPGSWALDKFGLRKCVIAGSFGTCLGAWVKALSASPDLWAVAFTGQTIVAISQTFVLAVPARLAAVWFGPDQVSSACSIGVFGNQLGVALGFILPPTLVPNSETKEEIGHDLRMMHIYVGIATSIILVLILIFFKSAPKKPPSPAQAAIADSKADGEMPDFKGSVFRLATNVGYVLLLISYGINVGVYYAISTLLNQIILGYFPGAGEDAGRIGLVIVVAGMGGSVVCGLILDKTHKFKETTLCVYILSLVGMLVYTFTMDLKLIWIVYLTAGFLGFFMTGYLPVGFEFAAELTYPEPEGTSAGLLNGVVQIFGITFTQLYAYCYQELGGLGSNLVLCSTLVVGAIVTALIKADLRRQKAQQAPDEALAAEKRSNVY